MACAVDSVAGTGDFSLLLDIFTCVDTRTCDRTCLRAWTAFLSTDVGFERALTISLAVQIYGSIKSRATLQNDCTEQGAVQKAKI